jgi:hypothetical protein
MSNVAMWQFLTDENFNRDIVRGLSLRIPPLDIVYAQDVGLTGVDDPHVLAWASQNNRILLIHDRATIPFYAYQHLAAGEKMPGVFVLPGRFPVGMAIDQLVMLVHCTEPSEWASQVIHLPL